MEFLRKPNTDSSLILVEEYKIGYIPIPKAGCSSFKYEISKLMKLDIEKKEVHSAMRPLMIKNFEKIEYKDYFIFSFVRNPYSRILSAFKSKVTPFKNRNTKNLVNGVQKALTVFYGNSFYGGMTFKEYLRNLTQIPDDLADEHFRSLHTFVYNKHGEKLVDYIGKLEYLSDEIKKLNNDFGLPFNHLEHFGNKSTHEHYSNYYDDEMIDIIQVRYSKDLELFNYEYNDLSYGQFKDL